MLQDGEALVEAGLEGPRRSQEILLGLSAVLRTSEGPPSIAKGLKGFIWQLVKVHHGMEAAAP